MSFDWTPHRFSGGALAFDLANSIVLREAAEGRIDRLADAGEIPRFAEAARRHSTEADLLTGAAPGGTAPATPAGPLIDLREAIDGHFRDRVRGGTGALAPLLASMAAAEGLADQTGDGFLAAIVRSTLQLLSLPEPDRIKLCGHCGWLFVDRSRNRSRYWCDMAVCGNRVKARRHYRRQQEESHEAHQPSPGRTVAAAGGRPSRRRLPA